MLLLQSQILNDGSHPVLVSVVEGGTDEAKIENAYMQLHQIMASSYANQNVDVALAQVMDDNGSIMKSDFFDRRPIEAGE